MIKGHLQLFCFDLLISDPIGKVLQKNGLHFRVDGLLEEFEPQVSHFLLDLPTRKAGLDGSSIPRVDYHSLLHFPHLALSGDSLPMPHDSISFHSLK